jgi:putative tryptophan/tyrosine transport system substrate-binding protein
LLQRAGAGLWPLIAWHGEPMAQPSRARSIGYLHPRTLSPDQVAMAALRPEWRRLGYVDNESLFLRSAEGRPDRLGPLAAELEQLGVGVIIAIGAEAVAAAHRSTRRTPIVGVDLETDPVRAGYVNSFSKPGGLLTGLFLDQPSITGKAVSILREASPKLQRIAILWQPSTGRHLVDAATTVLREQKLESAVLEYGPGTDYEALLRPLAGERRSGLLVLSSAGFSVDAGRCAAAAIRFELPTIAMLRVYARAGLMMSYGPKQESYFARAVSLADRIARGAVPGDMPIEKPTHFEFLVNAKTAAAIRINLPPSLLVQADEIL